MNHHESTVPLMTYDQFLGVGVMVSESAIYPARKIILVQDQSTN